MYGNRMVNEMSFVRNIFLSIIGSLYWGYLIRKCKYIKNTAVVLIPHNAGEDELYAYELIDNLIKENRYDNAVFLCSNKRNLKFLHMAHPNGRVCGAKRPKCEAERSHHL